MFFFLPGKSVILAALRAGSPVNRGQLKLLWQADGDEGQQAGMPVVSRHSAHIQPAALEMWIGDLRQPVGGVGKEQEEISVLLGSAVASPERIKKQHSRS